MTHRIHVLDPCTRHILYIDMYYTLTCIIHWLDICIYIDMCTWLMY